MQLSMISTKTILRPAVLPATRRHLVVRASSDSEQTANPVNDSNATVFYAGSSYNEEEWAAAVEKGIVAPAPQDPSETAVGELSISDAMAFSGPAPELINGRLAMLAFVSALGAELASGESALAQWRDEPTGVFLTFILFSAASLIPMLNSPNGAKREAFGPFSPEAETLNGRMAMIGFFALLVTETVRGGQALF